MKPMLEILAGVPTVVYGYFAALTVAPAVRDLAVHLGMPFASSESALAAGLVMGVMIIPFVSSDGRRFDRRGAHRDARRQPRDGRDQFETISKVLIPRRCPAWWRACCSRYRARSARR
jgi:phosphate transport system permease protein